MLFQFSHYIDCLSTCLFGPYRIVYTVYVYINVPKIYGRISVRATETRFPQADVLSDPSSNVAGAPCDGAWGDLGRRRLESDQPKPWKTTLR